VKANKTTRLSQLRSLIAVWERRVMTAPSVELARIAHAKLDLYRAEYAALTDSADRETGS
jgi:hypothetical protein